MFDKIIGAVAGDVIGGLFGNRRDDEAREHATAMSAQEYMRQKEFAQMGIRWKVDDAKAAGLHPLAAIGGIGASYSPTLALPASSSGPDFSNTGRAIGDALSSMGQNTTRAEMATKTATERRLEELAVRNAELRNSVLELELTAKTAALLGQPSNPPAPSPVGPSLVRSGPTTAAVGRSGIKVEPSTSVVASPSHHGVQAASTPFGKRYNVGRNIGITLPSQEAAESLEGLGIFQHLAGPALLMSLGLAPLVQGPSDGPPDKRMRWNILRQRWDYVPQSQPGRRVRGGGNVADHFYP